MENYDFVMSSGKYAGEPMSYIVHMDPDYYSWMLQNKNLFGPKQRRKIKKWIRKRDRYFEDSDNTSVSS